MAKRKLDEKDFAHESDDDDRPCKMVTNADLLNCQKGNGLWMCPSPGCNKVLSRKQTLRSHVTTCHGFSFEVACVTSEAVPKVVENDSPDMPGEKWLACGTNDLERAVAKLQLDNLDYARRPLSSSRFQDADLDAGDDMIIIYNRVPKTGSTSFAGIAYKLCSRNKFHVLHLNVTKNSHILSLSDQFRIVNNISTWEDKKPALYHGHLAYLEFSRFGVEKKPIFINLIRDPLDRLVSYYYFLRNGDDFRPHLKRRKAGNRETFDECVLKQGPDCDPNNLWMQIPFFCGHSAQCWEAGNRWALEQAKYNLVHNYLVVGITEELRDFVAILEATLPRFFRGAVDLFNKGEISRLRKTFNKISPSEDTVASIHESEVWKMENEFYEFAVEQFHFMKKRTFGIRDGKFVEKGKQFNYEKIRPR